MTPQPDFVDYTVTPCWGKFRHAIKVALNYKTRYVLFTSKGEPLLHPHLLSRYLFELSPYKSQFERIELQTEGYILSRLDVDQLKLWRHMGLDLVAISIYHYRDYHNAMGFVPDNLAGTNPARKYEYSMVLLLNRLREAGLLVRLSCSLMNGFIDTPEEVCSLLCFARTHDVFQLTLRTLGKPEGLNNLNNPYVEAVRRRSLNTYKLHNIVEYVKNISDEVGTLSHGAVMYDQRGQNIALTDCLTPYQHDNERIRQLIWMPPKSLTTSWTTPSSSRIF
jgi:hypothetical protein